MFRSIVKEFLKLIVFYQRTRENLFVTETIGDAALLQAAATKMAKEVLALQGVFKDKNKLNHFLFITIDLTR